LIVTLTINPAVDRTFSVDRLVFEDRAYILDRSEAAGGRGINASRVIHSFGGKTVAVLTAGGEIGKRIEQLLKNSGFRFEIVRVTTESRVNLTISDKAGLTAKLNEVGAPLSTKELDEARERVAKDITKAHWLMICGSMPPGVRAHYYCELIEMARSKGVHTLLDTDGDALLHALEAKPTVITPNHHEAERLLNRALITRSQILEAVDRIRRMGPESVVLSLGSRGAIGASNGDMLEAVPPRIEALCPIGAGDALAAAFVWAADKKKTFSESLRWGVAAGTATAKQPGMNFATLEQTKAVFKEVDIRPAR
jgi:1-phosphofructokinase family hexose kinase